MNSKKNLKSVAKVSGPKGSLKSATKTAAKVTAKPQVKSSVNGATKSEANVVVKAVSKTAQPKPSVGKPVISKPELNKPTLTKPVLTKPALTKPVATIPMAKPSAKPVMKSVLKGPIKMPFIDVNYDFKAGDNAVYPGHGVGKVLAIETKEILGSQQTFYSVQILETGMKIMIPKNNVASVGLRPIISQEEANKVVGILKVKDVKIDNQTWNRRYREYMEKIRTGSVYEIAEVLRDLFLLKVDKELSFGERKMLDTARNLLLKELTLATNQEDLFKEDEVKAIFGVEA